MLILLVLIALASPMMAADGSSYDPKSLGWIAAGLSMAIASGLCGLAQGKAVASSAEALARNPAAQGAIRFALILGLALIESLALYTLVIVFIKVG